MQQLVQSITHEIEWFRGLEKADMLGVIAFTFCCLILIAEVVRFILWAISRTVKPALDIDFKVEDVAFQSFRKKGFVTFDLYIQNVGRAPIEINRAGILLADGSEKALFQEPHILKTPDKSVLQPGEEAFFDDCDLFYCLNERPPYYKKIVGFFVDAKGYRRFSKNHDIPAIMNDQTIRATLTDQKGVNGF